MALVSRVLHVGWLPLLAPSSDLMFAPSLKLALQHGPGKISCKFSQLRSSVSNTGVVMSSPQAWKGNAVDSYCSSKRAVINHFQS